MIEIRRINNDKLRDVVYPLVSYAFSNTPPGPNVDDWENSILARRKTSWFYAIFEDGNPVACAANAPMTQNVRGKIFKKGGLWAVATRPEARRKGYIKQLMNRIFADMVDGDVPFGCLYPFRASFYERFGYVSFSHPLFAKFKVPTLAPLLKQDFGGEVIYEPIENHWNTYFEFVKNKIQPNVHGLAMFDIHGYSNPNNWMATARVNSEVVGMMPYMLAGEITKLKMTIFRFVYSESIGRYLLLQWIARHIDQASDVMMRVGPYEKVNSWLDDMNVEYDVSNTPMGRIINIDKIGGMTVGEGRFAAKIIDPYIETNNGVFQFDSMDGRLMVTHVHNADCELTIQGISALVYGTHHPEDFVFRGWGNPSPQVQQAMLSLFPPMQPYLLATY